MRQADVAGFARVLLLLAGLASAGSLRTGPVHAAPVQASEPQRFAEFLESVYQQNLAESPQLATEFGSKQGEDRWDDESERALAARAEENRRNIETAKHPLRLRQTRRCLSAAIPGVHR